MIVIPVFYHNPLIQSIPNLPEIDGYCGIGLQNPTKMAFGPDECPNAERKEDREPIALLRLRRINHGAIITAEPKTKLKQLSTLFFLNHYSNEDEKNI